MGDRDVLAAAVAQLRLMAGPLRDALEADGGQAPFERVSGGQVEERLPVNLDVASALWLLGPHLRSVLSDAAGQCGEARFRSAETALIHAERLHERLLVLGLYTEAVRLCAAVLDVLGAARRALGLERPDREIGAPCPMHAAPVVQLVTPGPRGVLTIEQGRPRVAMHHEPAIVCRHCSATWTPDQYPLLQNLIEGAQSAA